MFSYTKVVSKQTTVIEGLVDKIYFKATYLKQLLQHHIVNINKLQVPSSLFHCLQGSHILRICIILTKLSF